MTPTGIYLTDEEFAEIKRLLEGSMQINLETGINIYHEPDKGAAWRRLGEFAAEKGLPALPEGKSYGLNSHCELIAP